MLIHFAVPAFTEQSTESRVDGMAIAPNTDVLENENETIVMIELPGVERSAVKATFERGVLTVTAERALLEVPEKGRMLLREQNANRYRRSVRVHHPVEAGGVTAELEHGILRVVLPKAEVAKPRVIEVR